MSVKPLAVSYPWALAAWLVIAAAESVHGTLRSLLAAPLVGDFAARQMAVCTGSLIVLAIAYLFRDRIRAGALGECLAVGLIWVVLTVGFEIAVGRFVMRLDWDRILSDYDVAHGGLMPIGLLVMILSPAMVRRKNGWT